MKNNKKKYLIFFTLNNLPKRNMASSIQFVNSANAAANLGYPTVLINLNNRVMSLNPINWICPFRPKKPKKSLIKFYNIQKKLKIIALPNPWPIDSLEKKYISSVALAKRYFLPRFIFPKTKLFYTKDWNFAKLAVENKIPTIFDWDFLVEEDFESEIVNSPFFKLAVAITKDVKENMIKYGMPPEKVLQAPNGMNQSFLIRQPKKVKEWYRMFFQGNYKSIAVYAGALEDYKGISLLIDIAKELPEMLFVIAGGPTSREEHYKKIAIKKNVKNINFLGYIAHDKLISLLQSADVLAHPHISTADAEFTSPLKFFEYLASGTPIAITKIPALKEFEKNNLAMNWCKPDDPNEFAKCIQRTLEKYPRKIEGYKQNIEFAKKFTWEKRIEKILSYVDEKYRPEKTLTD